MFVEAREAVAAPRRELSVGQSRDDPAFEQWSNASPGSPLLVHDEQSQPSYWLVPIRRGPVTVGAVRVLGSGQVAVV